MNIHTHVMKYIQYYNVLFSQNIFWGLLEERLEQMNAFFHEFQRRF